MDVSSTEQNTTTKSITLILTKNTLLKLTYVYNLLKISSACKKYQLIHYKNSSFSVLTDENHHVLGLNIARLTNDISEAGAIT